MCELILGKGKSDEADRRGDLAGMVYGEGFDVHSETRNLDGTRAPSCRNCKDCRALVKCPRPRLRQIYRKAAFSQLTKFDNAARKEKLKVQL